MKQISLTIFVDDYESDLVKQEIQDFLDSSIVTQHQVLTFGVEQLTVDDEKLLTMEVV